MPEMGGVEYEKLVAAARFFGQHGIIIQWEDDQVRFNSLGGETITITPRCNAEECLDGFGNAHKAEECATLEIEVH